MDNPLPDQNIPQAFSSMNPATLSSPGNGLIQHQNMASSQANDGAVPAYPPPEYNAYSQVDPQLLTPPDSALQHVESPPSYPVVQGHPHQLTNPHTSLDTINYPPPQVPPSPLDSPPKRYQLDTPPSLDYTEQHYEPSYHLHRHKPVKVKHYKEK
ncbi:hypothetical protein I302_103561 [Kwoniella bestiolae CBS 10118]|uniref:Uncharacterized protein n=1 Tax=Kwoniella bestiolae CBS 10118 TaxID=1296100 RepID=A0A1B9G8V3_9TREE|nr:hypothetical protein I302_02262 [Kwoniella bestiolae CBS 10118]OCF27420.1 hypothetical protein I302_02262 [Kwoniella bestiolae CBS 10118]